jgi:hypothetical protein
MLTKPEECQSRFRIELARRTKTYRRFSPVARAAKLCINHNVFIGRSPIAAGESLGFPGRLWEVERRLAVHSVESALRDSSGKHGAFTRWIAGNTQVFPAIRSNHAGI